MKWNWFYSCEVQYLVCLSKKWKYNCSVLYMCRHCGNYKCTLWCLGVKCSHAFSCFSSRNEVWSLKITKHVLYDLQFKLPKFFDEWIFCFGYVLYLKSCPVWCLLNFVVKQFSITREKVSNIYKCVKHWTFPGPFCCPLFFAKVQGCQTKNISGCFATYLSLQTPESVKPVTYFGHFAMYWSWQTPESVKCVTYPGHFAMCLSWHTPESVKHFTYPGHFETY